MEMQFPVILDGATGTELQKRGFTGDMSAEQWVLEHPESILEIQRKYVASGSNVLYAPTFGGNRQKLEERGIFNRTEEMNKALVQLSKQAADGKAWVAGDIAPTGRFLAPLGDASFEELVDIYTEQVAGLEQAGVDRLRHPGDHIVDRKLTSSANVAQDPWVFVVTQGLEQAGQGLDVIETMMTLTDARAAVLAIRSMSKKPILVSFTCDESGKILSGTDVVAALSVMEGMGVSAFGLNCSAGPEQMLPQLQRLHKYARVPLIAKPNAGMQEIVNGEAVYNCPPEEFVALVPEMLKAGVALFGGCCGTTEEHIAALKAALKDAEYVRPAPECLDLLPAATEKEAFFLPADATHGAVLTADGDLEDKLSDAMDDEWPMVALKLASWADVDALADYQYMIRKPLCLICDDAELLEAGLRAYQGRALYEGNLTEDALAPLVEKYGLLV